MIFFFLLLCILSVIQKPWIFRSNKIGPDQTIAKPEQCLPPTLELNVKLPETHQLMATSNQPRLAILSLSLFLVPSALSPPSLHSSRLFFPQRPLAAVVSKPSARVPSPLSCVCSLQVHFMSRPRNYRFVWGEEGWMDGWISFQTRHED